MKLTRDVIKKISSIKKESEWMLNFRLNALDAFEKRDNATFGPRLDIDYDSINYYKEREAPLTND
jgi:Fe-S cluster assembly protein SufB